MEGGRRQLFCFALQSRRRRKKAGDGRCGKTSETPLQRRRSSVRPRQIEDADGASDRKSWWNTTMVAILRLAGIGNGAAWVSPVRSSLIRPARLSSPCRQRGSAGVVSSDLRRCYRVRRGPEEDRLRGVALFLGQADGSGFPALIRPPVEADGKPQPHHGPAATATKTETRDCLAQPRGLAAKWPPPPLR